MKAIFILAVFVLAACGKVSVPSDAKLATMNSLTPQSMGVGSSEYSKIKEVCDALNTKTQTISSLTNTEYVFSNTVKQCTDTSFLNAADTPVRLVNQSSSYKFAEGANLFYFSDVETIDQGILSVICSKLNINQLASPIAIDSNNYLYFTAVNINGGDCLTTSNERCLKIERAAKVSKTEARVHSREWIKTRLDQPRLGFYSYRKLISEASCLEGQYFGRTATLK